LSKLDLPSPQIGVGLALRGLANSAIDISDGLNADLNHVLTASNVGADINVDKLPLSDAFQSLKLTDSWQLAVSAGDDYELCFTVPELQEKEMKNRLDALGCAYSKIGVVSKQEGVRWIGTSGKECVLSLTGYDHFR
jgi:thiamine-monophosphate kinase